MRRLLSKPSYTLVSRVSSGSLTVAASTAQAKASSVAFSTSLSSSAPSKSASASSSKRPQGVLDVLRSARRMRRPRRKPMDHAPITPRPLASDEPPAIEVPTVTKTGGREWRQELEKADSMYEGKDIVRKRKKGSVRELTLTMSRPGRKERGRKSMQGHRKPAPNVLIMREQTIRFEDQMKALREKYRKEYSEWKAEQDQASVERFMAFRERVLEYRREKRELAVSNVRRHEEYMFHLGNEYDRLRLEKNMDRLNKEGIESAMRIDALNRLRDESHTYITAENIDEHIAQQLDPERLVVPTIFYNRLGVNDEVRLEIHKSVVRQLQYDQAKRNNNREKMLQYEYESLLVSDDMYPHDRMLDPRVDYVSMPFDTRIDMLKRSEEMMRDEDMGRHIRQIRRAQAAEEDEEEVVVDEEEEE